MWRVFFNQPAYDGEDENSSHKDDDDAEGDFDEPE
jgi:hypothetical protein